MHSSRFVTFFVSSLFVVACSSTPQGQNPDVPGTGTADGSSSTAAPTDTATTSDATSTSASSTSASTSTSSTASGGPQAVAPSADRGQKLFGENTCTACHGTAEKPKKNIFTIKWSDERKAHAVETIKKGKSPMPGYGDKFTDADIADLLAFLGAK